MPMGAIASLSTGTYSVTRRTRGTRTDGYYSPGSSSTVDLGKGVLYPGSASPGDVRPMPEGVRLEDTIVLITTVEMKAHSDTHEADLLEEDGVTYKVCSCEPWKGFGQRAWKAVLAKTEVP